MCGSQIAHTQTIRTQRATAIIIQWALLNGLGRFYVIFLLLPCLVSSVLRCSFYFLVCYFSGLCIFRAHPHDGATVKLSKNNID